MSYFLMGVTFCLFAARWTALALQFCVVKDEKDEWEEMTRGEISQHGRVCCTSVCLQQGAHGHVWVWARRHYSPGLSAGHLGRSGVSQISVNATFRTLATHCPFPNSML